MYPVAMPLSLPRKCLAAFRSRCKLVDPISSLLIYQQLTDNSMAKHADLIAECRSKERQPAAIDAADRFGTDLLALMMALTESEDQLPGSDTRTAVLQAAFQVGGFLPVCRSTLCPRTVRSFGCGVVGVVLNHQRTWFSHGPPISPSHRAFHEPTSC